MGTAADGSGQERSGDGESPGARPADQITPEPPEERLPHRPRRAGQLSRTGRELIERAANHPAGQIAAKEGGTAGPPPAKVPSLQRSEHKPIDPAVPRPLEESDALVRRSRRCLFPGRARGN